MTSRIQIALVLIGVVLALGTVGYMGIEGWSFFDSLYMTVITVSTVGYHEVGELTPGGRVLTLVIITLGISLVAYAVSGILEDEVENRIRQVMGRRRMEKQTRRLSGHTVVCGYGRMGTILTRELHRLGAPFSVVDMAAERTMKCDARGYHYLLGDALDEEVLRQAGVRRARALVAALATDADNLLVTLTARGLNEDLRVIARCEDPRKEKNFLRAGAATVISPQAIGARRAADMLLRPNVTDFIDLATQSENLELIIDEMAIAADSPFAGHSLRESGLRQRTGHIVLVIKRLDGEMVFNPPPDSMLQSGDTLVTVGRKGGTNGDEARV
ncbi:MAG: potassium channel family protein [Acidobacteriota bacterium]